ncbi:MAG: phenylacetate-coenzyme A ligase PaaK-like adenylate-forming protein, partial [Candidatus Endobugula sp.]
MHSVKSLSQRIFCVDQASFNDLAFDIFDYQVKNNLVYRAYIEKLGSDISKIHRLEDIPFLPIEFFKTQKVISGEWESDLCFESSGTT